MGKLWQKSGTRTNPLITRYIVSEDLASDKRLLPYDIAASIAHARMLGSVKLISQKEVDSLVKTLKEIDALAQKGKFKITQENEDCHTAIENYLVKKLGEVGKKIHTGRSRNDQVLMALRLFSKEKLNEVQKAVLDLSETILAFAKKYEFVPMPGYTHMQQAMPSSIGQWSASFVESLLDDFKMLQAAYDLNDQNPLGSAAGFGTSLPINRDYTTKLLGFAKTQINTLYCQNSRGKFEAFTLAALVQVMMTLGKIANDVLLFTTQEFNFFTVNSAITTGSSIMPQKKNLDLMEVVRANVAVVTSYEFQVVMLSHNLISGYNKDFKVIKKPLIEAFDIVMHSIKATDLLFHYIKPNIERLKSSLDSKIFATDKVNKLVQQGMPFRDAYRKVGRTLKQLKKQDVLKNLKAKKHLGAPGNLRLKSYEKDVEIFMNSKQRFYLSTKA